MVRNYACKADRSKRDENSIKEAVSVIKNKQFSL